MSRLALVVEPSLMFRARLEALVEASGWQPICRSTLEEARKDIADAAPSILIASLKLGSFNGIHLVYLAKLANPSAVCIVYGEPGRGEEAQRSGAIYIERSCLSVALPDLLKAKARHPAKRTSELKPHASDRVVWMRSHRKT